MANLTKIDKVMETVMVKDFTNKDLFAAGPRQYIMYLGDDDFENTFNMWIKAKRNEFEIEKARKKATQ